MAKLTPAQKAKQSQALKEAWAKRKATQTPKMDSTDYKTLYNAELSHSKELEAKLNASENKNTELEKICKSYAEQANNASNTLQKMALEYDARTKYMLDCVKHAYLSIQFAANATDNNKGDK